MERRNATLLAIAPTKSSSFILGQVSPSIEPYTSNYYLKDLQKARITFRSPFLEELLQAKGKNEEKVWRSILERNGSVQHLDFLSDEEKDVFKTFSEISQKTLVNLAIGPLLPVQRQCGSSLQPGPAAFLPGLRRLRAPLVAITEGLTQPHPPKAGVGLTPALCSRKVHFAHMLYYPRGTQPYLEIHRH